MPANISISVSGSMEEVSEALQQIRLLTSLPGIEPEAPTLSQVEEDQDKLPLEPSQIARLYAVLPPGARDVLAEVARLGGHCSNADVMQKLGLTKGFQVGGRLSAYGRAVKRLKLTDRQPLYAYDYVNKRFMMEPGVAQVILSLP